MSWVSQGNRRELSSNLHQFSDVRIAIINLCKFSLTCVYGITRRLVYIGQMEGENQTCFFSEANLSKSFYCNLFGLLLNFYHVLVIYIIIDCMQHLLHLKHHRWQKFEYFLKFFLEQQQCLFQNKRQHIRFSETYVDITFKCHY